MLVNGFLDDFSSMKINKNKVLIFREIPLLLQPDFLKVNLYYYESRYSPKRLQISSF